MLSLRPARLSVALAVLVPLAGLAQQPRDAASTSGTRVDGRLIDSTGRPMAGAKVTLANWPSWERTVATDPDGRFEFRGVPAGRFSLRAERDGYFRAEFGAVGGSGTGTLLVVTSGQDITDLTLTMTRGATVSGVLLRPDGLPAANVPMMLAADSGGLAGHATTDASGAFRIIGIGPGDYRVVTAYFAIHLGLPRARYAPVFHPGTNDPAAATLLRIQPEEDHDVGEFRLVVSHGVSFSGVVLREDGTAADGARIHMSTRSGLEGPTLAQVPDAAGRFRFSNVAPGRYTLSASLALGSEGRFEGVALREIDVGGEELAGEEIQLGPPGRLSGRVVFAGTQAPPADVGAVRMFVGRVGYIPGEVDVRDDGTFVHDVFPGLHVISAHVPDSATPRWRLRAAMWNGIDLIDRPPRVEPGSMELTGIELIFSDGETALSGTVLTEAGAPGVDARLIVFPADPAAWHEHSPRIMTLRPDTHGEFRMAGLLPGDYLVAATREPEGPGGRSVEFLERLAAKSVPVTIAEGQPIRLNLRRDTP